MEIQYHEARTKKSQTFFFYPISCTRPLWPTWFQHCTIIPVSIYCSALSAFSLQWPLSNGRNVACNDVTLLPAALIATEHPCMRSPVRKVFVVAAPGFAKFWIRSNWNFLAHWHGNTLEHVACVPFLLYTSGPCMEDVHASIGTHSREVNSAKSAIPGKRLAQPIY